jgi:hypothetical protein
VGSADHRDDAAAAAAGLEQPRHQVLIALVDQGPLDLGHRAAELGQHVGQRLGLLQILDHLRGDRLVAAAGGLAARAGAGLRSPEQRAEQRDPPPRAEAAPGALERDVDVAIDQLDRDPGGLGGLDRGEQLGAGLDPELGPDPALVRGQRDLREHVQRAPVAHDPGHVEVAEHVAAGQRLEPPAVELDAHHLGPDPRDGRADLVDALGRHVGRADHVERGAFGSELGHRHRAGIARALRYTHRMPAIPDATRTEIEAAAFRRLVEHFRERTDVQNLDVMNLAGFCRNCLSKWYRAAAVERGIELSDPEAREAIYGMPYDEWKTKYQK